MLIQVLGFCCVGGSGGAVKGCGRSLEVFGKFRRA